MSKSGSLLVLLIGVVVALALIGFFAKVAVALLGLIITVAIWLCAGAIGFVSTMWAMSALSGAANFGSAIPIAVGVVVLALVASLVNSFTAFLVIGCLGISACNALAVLAVRALDR